MNDERPNFLIICVDQMRADHMGCDGNPVIKTPHLDTLAVQGVLLQRAYVNNPLCMPSRATMFSGLTPRGHRVRTNGISLDPALPTVPVALAEAGYHTATIGKVHLTTHGVRPDFAPEGLPPEQFPEQHRLWKAGRITRVPTPYFGFQHVEMAALPVPLGAVSARRRRTRTPPCTSPPGWPRARAAAGCSHRAGQSDRLR